MSNLAQQPVESEEFIIRANRDNDSHEFPWLYTPKHGNADFVKAKALTATDVKFVDSARLRIGGCSIVGVCKGLKVIDVPSRILPESSDSVEVLPPSLPSFDNVEVGDFVTIRGEVVRGKDYDGDFTVQLPQRTIYVKTGDITNLEKAPKPEPGALPRLRYDGAFRYNGKVVEQVEELILSEDGKIHAVL